MNTMNGKLNRGRICKARQGLEIISRKFAGGPAIRLLAMGILLWGSAYNSMAVVWTSSYEGDVFPESATPAWTENSIGGTRSLGTIGSTNFLNINTFPDPSEQRHFVQNNLSVWDGSTDSTIEIRARVNSQSGTDGAGEFNWRSGSFEDLLALRVGSIGLRSNVSNYTMDTSDFHTYRITLESGAPRFKIYVDNNDTPVLNGTGDAETSNLLVFGDFQGIYGGSVDWDYIRWTNAGAFPAIPEASTATASLLGLLVLFSLKHHKAASWLRKQHGG